MVPTSSFMKIDIIIFIFILEYRLMNGQRDKQPQIASISLSSMLLWPHMFQLNAIFMASVHNKEQK
jgi:hypothetical protein